MTILPEQIYELRECFLRGLTISWAKDKAGVAYDTAARYYAQFTAQGIERGKRQRKPTPHYLVMRFPVYTGPKWIGVLAPGSRPPVPVGPDWIGKPITV